MNATKRKFNALLQGLGSSRPRTLDDIPTTPDANLSPSSKSNASPISTSNTMGSDADILQKRRRLGLPDSTAPVLRNATGIATTFSNIVLRKPEAQPSAKDRRDAPARYSPSDRGELLRRLATFQEITDWTPKPDRVNEVEWAKRGWVCQGKETVRCMLCHKELVVKLNRKLVDGKEVPVLVPSEIEEALVDKYADFIVDSHQEDCLWRKRGCDDSILRLSLANASASLEALRQRYDELSARKSFLPYEFNLRLPEDLKLDGVLSQLPPDFFTQPAPVDGTAGQAPNRVALALALMGWQGLTNARIGAVPNSASCHTCLRRLGLWMFKSKEVTEGGEVLVPAPMDFLDPVREHRFFCPWANAATQKRGSSQSESEFPGWQVLQQTLTNEAHLRGVYEGRPATRPKSQRRGVTPSTPQKLGAVVPGASPQSVAAAAITEESSLEPIGSEALEEDDNERDAKDKERWARLRRVKSLFDSKGSKKFKRSISRPGTSHSTRSVADGGKE
ncbi:hypothetical protein G7046_g2569 [Stylonectria norvegica]|nr:hypothetical protein G7046_g2569 [Stylonectria norvegica]